MRRARPLLRTEVVLGAYCANLLWFDITAGRVRHGRPLTVGPGSSFLTTTAGLSSSDYLYALLPTWPIRFGISCLITVFAHRAANSCVATCAVTDVRRLSPKEQTWVERQGPLSPAEPQT